MKINNDTAGRPRARAYNRVRYEYDVHVDLTGAVIQARVSQGDEGRD
jgi:hypothetical protein